MARYGSAKYNASLCAQDALELRVPDVPLELQQEAYQIGTKCNDEDFQSFKQRIKKEGEDIRDAISSCKFYSLDPQRNRDNVIAQNECLKAASAPSWLKKAERNETVLKERAQEYAAWGEELGAKGAGDLAAGTGGTQ